MVVPWLKSPPPPPRTPAGSQQTSHRAGQALPGADLGPSMPRLVAARPRHVLLAGATPEAEGPQHIRLRSLSLGLWPLSGTEGTARLYLF